MASTYSANLKLELMGTGDQSGTWGNTTNNNLGTLLEQAIVGYATQIITDGADTVLTIANGSSSVSRNFILELTGVLTANRTLVVPAIQKSYVIYNNTSGGYSVTVKVSGQTGVTVVNGKKAFVYNNGTDIIEIVNAPVNESGAQTLTNKTISADNNTISGIAASSFVLSDASGNLDGGAAQKAIPSGAVVGTTDSQVLTNKTLSVDDNTIGGIAASSFVISNGSGNIDGAAAQKAVPSGDVVGASDTQTLTNKRINPRISSSASTTSPLAWNGDNFDEYAYTALANDLTISADAGTPVDGQKIVFRFQDNGTARTLTFTGGASKGFEPVGVSMLVSGSNFTYTTSVSKKTYIGCIYNASDVRWDIVAIAQEA